MMKYITYFQWPIPTNEYVHGLRIRLAVSNKCMKRLFSTQKTISHKIPCEHACKEGFDLNAMHQYLMKPNENRNVCSSDTCSKFNNEFERLFTGLYASCCSL